jgi:hypothetical protein
MRVAIRSLAAVVFAFAVSAAAEDLTIVAKVSRDSGPAGTATSYLSGDRIRVVTGDGNEMIADLKTGDTTMIDHKKRQYFTVTRQDLEQLQARMKQAMNSPEMQRAQEQMKNLPPEVQKRMQAAMGGGITSAVSVQKTGTSRKIAGYNCENWTVAFGQISKSEECLTTELPLPAQAWQSYQDFAARMRGMNAAMGPIGKGITELQEKMKDMKGFPLSKTTTASFMGRSMTSTIEVTDVKKGPVPASAWEIPAGYAKVDNPMLKAGAPRM